MSIRHGKHHVERSLIRKNDGPLYGGLADPDEAGSESIYGLRRQSAKP